MAGASSCVRLLHHQAEHTSLVSQRKQRGHLLGRRSAEGPVHFEEEESSLLHLRLRAPPSQLNAASRVVIHDTNTLAAPSRGPCRSGAELHHSRRCLFVCLFNFSRRFHAGVIKSRLIQYLCALLLHYSPNCFYVLLHFPHRH